MVIVEKMSCMAKHVRKIDLLTFLSPHHLTQLFVLFSHKENVEKSDSGIKIENKIMCPRGLI